MRLRRCHAGFAREVLQRHRPTMVREREQQLAADLDALDAALTALDRQWLRRRSRLANRAG